MSRPGRGRASGQRIILGIAETEIAHSFVEAADAYRAIRRP